MSSSVPPTQTSSDGEISTTPAPSASLLSEWDERQCERSWETAESEPWFTAFARGVEECYVDENFTNCTRLRLGGPRCMATSLEELVVTSSEGDAASSVACPSGYTPACEKAISSFRDGTGFPQKTPTPVWQSDWTVFKKICCPTLVLSQPTGTIDVDFTCGAHATQDEYDEYFDGGFVTGVCEGTLAAAHPAVTLVNYHFDEDETLSSLSVTTLAPKVDVITAEQVFAFYVTAETKYAIGIDDPAWASGTTLVLCHDDCRFEAQDIRGTRFPNPASNLLEPLATGPGSASRIVAPSLAGGIIVAILVTLIPFWSIYTSRRRALEEENARLSRELQVLRNSQRGQAVQGNRAGEITQ